VDDHYPSKTETGGLLMTCTACRPAFVRYGLRYWQQGVLILLSCLSAACTVAPRRPAPPTLFAQVAPPGFPPHVRTLSDYREYFATHLAAQVRDLRTAAGSGSIRILALSGGAGGSFGAGALYGLTRAGNRPDFQVVTGVSAGLFWGHLLFSGRTGTLS
jgi:hypothetical protein